ncbi:MAG TPA: tetratricopeptide repeat protein [Candidatus Angelobacter sp.]
MTSYCLILLAFLLPMQRFLASVSGQILDREGNPMAGAEVVYTNVGTVDRLATRIIAGTGKVYKVKTDKNGKFSLIGVEYGVYQIEITASDGSHVYSGKKHVGDIADTDVEAQNVLNVDLSSVYNGPADPGGTTNLAAGKKTKEQLDLIRQENARAAQINKLMVQYHTAVGVEDWLNAISLIKKLIAVDPNRWEFYQNLGTLQSRQMQYAEAAQSFATGVEVAQKTLKNASDSDRALTTIGDLMLAEADCYDRIEKVDEAVGLYQKAAATYPHPFMAKYRACNALTNAGKYEAAIETCNQASAEDPAQWEPYQVLGGIYTTLDKPQDALESYQKGTAAAQKVLQERSDSKTKVGLGQMLNSEGNLLVKLKKYDEAIGVFAQAAESAAYPAMPYFNLCATYYNLKRSQEAVAACEHAIASDPTLADAYYIKGSILFGQGQLEHGKYAVPPGTTEALNKYLEYAPYGDHVLAVRDMINQLSKDMGTVYKPAKKK